MSDFDNVKLLAKLKKGNTKAFEEIYNHNYSKVYRFIYRLTGNADDSKNFAQEAFIVLWENREKLEDSTLFDRYLYKVSRYIVLNSIRKKINEKIYEEYLLKTSSEHDNSLENSLQFNELEDFIKTNINKIPLRRREIFLLSYEKGLAYKELAKVLGLSEYTVDTQIRNALDYLRKAILKNYLFILKFISSLSIFS
jgi:RNA polymerase sigma-70 factor (ECF subfamily)